MNGVQSSNRLTFGGRTLSWGDLRADAERQLGASDRFAAHRTVFVVDGARQAMACIVYGLEHGLDYGVIETERVSEAVRERFAGHGVRLVDYGTPQAPSAVAAGAEVEPGRVTVLTSGTTGLLKLIDHNWQTLNTFDRVRQLPENAWFLPYQIGSYAWFQMVALSLFVPGQDLVCGDFGDLAASFEAALQAENVTAISSTPTFWRHALMTIDEAVLAKAPLRSISMGGEIVDQAIIDRLKTLYPDARLRHIYASSEAGAAIVVTDGLAGFDAGLTERDSGTIAVKVEDGRLYIRSPYANRADAAGWVDTGDLVERRGNRYFFCGRAGNEMINVGGQKAFPPDIEARLMAHPNVAWAQVTARRAPLVGSLPMARVVLSGDIDPAEAERILSEHCIAGLAEYAVPRMWEFLDEVPMRASLKS